MYNLHVGLVVDTNVAENEIKVFIPYNTTTFYTSRSYVRSEVSVEGLLIGLFRICYR